ncbi:MAG: SMP-30/gluconolactonase/LRE family protein [Rhodoblastus sp.]
MKRFVAWLGVVLMVLAGYFAFWPIPISPNAWTAEAAPGYVGPHVRNTRLAGLQTIDIGNEAGPEHIAFGPDGKLYAAVASGNILRMDAKGSNREVFVNTGGRTLGFDFDPSGRLIAADALRGLLAVTKDKVEVLTDKVDGEPIRYADAVVVAKDGLIYFSDASQRFGPRDWGGTFEASVLDIMEQAATGRILVYDVGMKTTKVVASGLSFANGVAMSSDEKSIFVAETGKYRIWKVPVAARNLDLSKGPAGGAAIVLGNLPGYPDNLMRGLPTADGKPKLWVGLTKPRNALIDRLADKPFIRAMIMRLPRAFWPIPPAYGHVFAFTEDGKIVEDLQDPSGAYPETTSAAERIDGLFIQSLHAKTIGWMKRP